MVNAGVYLILRMAPLYHGTLFSSYLAFFGAFTFIATSTLALSQKNGKKILAYSTIANLGMIVACAGIGSPAAIAAGILLILFHAVAKGLLFMCMGYVEQNIGSRMIEDMRGLYGRMPKTTIIMVFGMITMFLPPFGALLSKWMVIEASAHNPMVVIMLALGSAFTVVFWARWAGLILCNTRESAPQSESQPLFVRLALLPLAVLGFVLSLLVAPIYSTVVAPVVGLYYQKGFYLLSQGGFSSEIGAFSIYKQTHCKGRFCSIRLVNAHHHADHPGLFIQHSLCPEHPATPGTLSAGNPGPNRGRGTGPFTRCKSGHMKPSQTLVFQGHRNLCRAG
jgi:ech hydrogenase subunit A